MAEAPETVKRLVDLSACNAQVDRFDQDRKVFLSGDYQAGTRDWGLGTGDPDPNPKPLAPNPSCAVLGQVYGQSLGLSACGHAQAGKVIRLTAGHQAKVEEEPEVRKAGGVLACV